MSGVVWPKTGKELIINFIDSSDVEYAEKNNIDPEACAKLLIKPKPIVKEKETLKKKKVEEEEEPICELDKYFKKTKALPVLYYLPLTDEEADAKEKGNIEGNEQT